MTIYALSTGPGISGVAIIRISGPEASNVIKSLTQKNVPKPRIATLRKINNTNTSELIDEGIILWFPGPESYTGEDMAEIQVHGCLLYTSPSPRDGLRSRMPSSA